MTDWAAWGTSVGTLVLAGATFAAVRSSNRSARIAERSLLAGLRPLLTPSRPEDPDVQVQFADGRVFATGGGRALIREDGPVLYLAIPVRNAGAGMALLRGYHLEGESAQRAREDPQGVARHRRGEEAPPLESFSEQQRDLYVPPGGLGHWQAALRDPAEERHRRVREAIATDGRITVDLLYTDHEDGQPAITRFVALPEGPGRWRPEVARHWSVPES
jgi:hypothetical protein